MKKQHVYLLQHEYETYQQYEYHFIGIYSTRKEALIAKKEAQQLPGFRDWPANCFYIDKCELDKDEGWLSGFDTSTTVHYRRLDNPLIWEALDATILNYTENFEDDLYKITMHQDDSQSPFKCGQIVKCKLEEIDDVKDCLVISETA